jgi:membrane protease YdiL (CAAX protease family)
VRSPLAAWTAFVLAFGSLSYASRFAEGKPPDDVLYRWSTLEGNLIQFAIIGAIVYAIAGLGDRRRLLALRRPTSWGLAVGIGIGIGVGMLLLTWLLSPLLHPGQEQGITPDQWEPKHAAAYVANGLVIVIVAPIIEELTFRGLGYSLLVPFGRWTAIVLVGLAFGFAHGLVNAFLFLAAFGGGLAYLRSRVDSVYPGMIVHGLFNALALTVAVAGKEPETGNILHLCVVAWSALLPY